MESKNLLRILLILCVGAGLVLPAASAAAAEPKATAVTAYDLIVAMNTLRVSNGLPALVEDPIIDAVAHATAVTMAANNLSSHIGNASGRVQAAGYGGGAKVYATENIALGFHSIDEIMLVWSDAAHMIPANNPAYCNIGAGTAKSAAGVDYYVLQAAYVGSKACGAYTSVGGATLQPGGSTGATRMRIVPVQVATPGPDGRVLHVVKDGQSLWAIAIAYKVTVKDLQTWNNLAASTLVVIGQKLVIPGSGTQGYATPTPVGVVLTSTPGPDGKVVHVVQPYQNLSTISDAYDVSVNTLLRLNGIQVDTPLQISQKLLVVPAILTPSMTPQPTVRPLTPLEKLTPAADGKYYHTVKAGENLSSIAALYKATTADLMAWNGLTAASVLQPGQKLLLQVTPPPTATATPGPSSPTPPPTAPAPTETPAPTLAATQAPTASLPAALTATPAPASDPADPAGPLGFIILGLAGLGLLVVLIFSRRKG